MNTPYLLNITFMFCLVLACGRPTAPSATSFKIVNGKSFKIEDGLYQASVLIDFREGSEWNICTGTLIDRSWVLTAAHCRGTAYSITPYSGSKLIAKASKTGQAFPLLDTIVTVEDLKKSDYHEPLSDIMLIRLDSPFELSENHKVAFIPDMDASFSKESFWAVGSGEHDNQVNIGNELRWTLIDRIEVDPSLNLVSSIGRNTNQGDSGGGLFRRNKDGGIEVFAVHSGIAAYKSRWTYLPAFHDAITKLMVENP